MVESAKCEGAASHRVHPVRVLAARGPLPGMEGFCSTSRQANVAARLPGGEHRISALVSDALRVPPVPVCCTCCRLPFEIIDPVAQYASRHRRLSPRVLLDVPGEGRVSL